MSDFEEFEESITVTRTAAGSYINGTWADGAESVVTMTAIVESYEPNQYDIKLQNLDLRGAIWLTTYEPLFTVKNSPGKKADLVEYQGQNYQVAWCESWQKILPHYEAVATLLPEE